MTQKPQLSEQPILRDRLALDRTKLANERTLLAYLRTALMLVLSGITIIKLVEIQGGRKDLGLIVLACVLLAVGIITGILGSAHCYRAARRMRRWERPLNDVTSDDSSENGV